MKSALFGTACCILLLPTAMAQDGEARQDTVIVTGTKNTEFGGKSGIPIAEMPQAVQLLESDDIISTGSRSIEDALRVVPSATVAGSRIGSGTSNTLRIRGFGAQIMRNGIRQRFYEGVDSSALSNIERVEVLKGPAGVLYGQSGVGGIVSIITKRPTDSFESEFALTLGSDGQRMASVDVGGPLTDTLGIRLTAEIERSDTFVDYIDLDRENIGLAVVWTPTPHVSANLVAEYLNRETRNNPGLPTIGTVIDNGVGTVDPSTFLGEPDYNQQENDAPLIQAWVDIRLSDDWTLTPRLQYSEFNNRSLSTTLLPPVTGDPTLIDRVGRNAGENDRFYIAQLDLAGNVQLLGLNHDLLFGVEYSDEQVNFRMQDNVPCGVGPIDSLEPSYGCGPPTSNFGFLSVAGVEGTAFYAQDQISLTERWKVLLGLRYSEFTNDNAFITAFSASENTADLSNTTWQIGTTYDLGTGFSLFGGYNTGYDLEWVIGARNRNGDPFQPETSDQAELGLRFSNSDLQASASVFRINRNDVAVPDPADLGFQKQDGRFTINGFEVEGQWSVTPDWSIRAGYAFLDGEISKTTDPTLEGAELAETPENSFTASTAYYLGAVELRAAANYVDDRNMLNGGSVTIPSYTTVDVGAGIQMGNWRVDAALSNLFDETYYYSDNLFVYSIGTEDRLLPGQPRTFTVRASYEWGR